MEEQDSILLQKKMILTMSMIIFVLIFSLAILKNQNSVRMAIALNEFNSNLITVERDEDFENDIILIEQIAYTAVEEINETKMNNIEEESQNNEETKEITEEVLVEEKIATNSLVEEENKIEVKYKSYRELAENNPPTEYTSVVEATATAYCLCQKCCGKSPSNPMYGYTASGLKIVPGTGMKVIAVDSNVIPLGTKVYVEGLNGAWDYGYAIAADTGSAIKNLKIDLYMDSHDECFVWGVKKVKVYALEDIY